MALAHAVAMASASPSASIDIPKLREGDMAQTSFSALPKHGAGLLTPPNSISPHMPAHAANHLKSPPLLNIVEEDGDVEKPATPPQESSIDEIMVNAGASAPLSMSALSGLDARATITPALLAKEFLPSIMLGNGPRPIRHVMGELTHTVPGFSRIPPAKARRLVVAALESRDGGGHDGNVLFSKTGWGRWDAHMKGEQPELDQTRPQHATSSPSMDESGDIDMDMDMPENEADKMSMDENDMDVFSSESDDEGDVTDDDDWAAVGPHALRKASLPAPGQPAPPRTNYQALGIPITKRPSFSNWSRRFSAVSDRSLHSAAMASYSPQLGPLNTALQTPEEKVAIEALLRMGSI